MSFLVPLFFLLLGCIALGFSSSKAIDYALKTAQLFGFSKIFIGFVLLALATGLPELFIALQAIILGEATLSVGDIIGSNFVDISLSLGIAVALLGPVRMPNSTERKKQLVMLALSSLIMIFIFTIGQLTPIVGFILLCVYTVGIAYLWATRRELLKLEVEEQIDILQEQLTQLSRGTIITRLSGSLLLVILSSKVCVDNALVLAENLALPVELMGASIVAVGTSLPEISLNIQALRKGNISLALGNALGSVFAQGGLILGLLALTTKTPLPLSGLHSILPFMLTSYGLLAYYLVRDRLFSRAMGLLLISCYVLFLLYSFSHLYL